MRPITIRLKKRKLRAIKMLLFVILFLLLLFGFDQHLRPIIGTVANYQSQLIATKIMNDAVLDIIKEEDLEYNDIIHLNYTADGQVASLSTDMITMNRLKAEVSNNVSQTLQNDLGYEVKIPIGTFLNSAFFAGRGPELKFRVLPAGYVETKLYNDFLSEGINQTLHRIMMTINVRVSAVSAFYTTTTDVSTNVCLAQTMIVGKIPSAFAALPTATTNSEK